MFVSKSGYFWVTKERIDENRGNRLIVPETGFSTPKIMANLPEALQVSLLVP